MSEFTFARRASWPKLNTDQIVPYLPRTQVVSWPDASESHERIAARHDVTDRVIYALVLLEDVIVIDPETRGGVPVLIGTRVPISRLFAEVAAGRAIGEIADDKELDLDKVRQVFQGFAAYLARSFGHEDIST